MASFEEHCAGCRRELGEPFEQVHEWLDALFRALGLRRRAEREGGADGEQGHASNNSGYRIAGFVKETMMKITVGKGVAKTGKLK